MKHLTRNKLGKRRDRKSRFSSLENLENRTLLTVNGIEVQVAPVVDFAPTAEVAQQDAAQSQDRVQRIVNGEQSNSHESVGMVNGGCTGTLITPTAVLTAAHCVEEGGAQTFELDGKSYDATSVTIHPDYGSRDIDLAVMTLSENVVGIEPSDINRVTPQVGQMLTLVGFGGTGTTAGHNGDFGVKHEGQTPIDEVTETGVNWNFDNPNEANTAPGDSGGPAFVNQGGQLVIAGVTSGGTLDSAGLGDYSFDTRVDTFASWIDGVASGDIVGTPVVDDGGGGSGSDGSDDFGDGDFGDGDFEDDLGDEFNDGDFIDDEFSDDDFDNGGDDFSEDITVEEVQEWVAVELELYDQNGNGMLSKKELKEEFLDYGLSNREAREEAQYLLDTFDTDGNNQLDSNELVDSYLGEGDAIDSPLDDNQEDNFGDDGSFDEIDDEFVEEDAGDDFDEEGDFEDDYSADVDNDGEIGFLDFLIMSSNYGESEMGASDGDITADGVIDFFDFLAMSESWGEIDDLFFV